MWVDTIVTLLITKYLKSCKVVSDDTLLPDVLCSLGWVRQTTTFFLLLLLRLCLQDYF